RPPLVGRLAAAPVNAGDVGPSPASKPLKIVHTQFDELDKNGHAQLEEASSFFNREEIDMTKWEDAGISRATYFRRRKAKAEAEALAARETETTAVDETNQAKATETVPEAARNARETETEKAISSDAEVIPFPQQLNGPPRSAPGGPLT